ncbi:MAG: type I methionyl aminopeptidase [Anaerolineae bacterium]
MTVRTKSALELQHMRRAGALVAEALAALRAMVAPGVTTADLDAEAERVIRSLGGIPSFKGYRGYPATICASINAEIVHGIPGPRRLEEGQIVSLDVGAIWEGYQGDSAITVGVGQISENAQRLIEAAEDALRAGIGAVRAGARMGDVSHAIEAMARAQGFAVVREYGGHGIGKAMHESPNIPNWGPAGRGVVLKAGMTFALEPMLVAGDYRTRQLADGWTVVTADGNLAAHSEHTVAVKDDGAEILTRRDGLASS